MDQEQYQKRRAEDFRFMVLCEMKGNMGLYQLLRDRELDDVVIQDKQELRLWEGG